jgi:D-serine deaminase-like pyridoxal phosphate-dependent protein
MHLEEGVTKFKCSTLAEAEMAARAGAPDVLIAYQLAGPNLARFNALRKEQSGTRFSVLCDNEQTLRALSRLASESDRPIPVYLDIDCGMGRTGIRAGDEAFELFKLMCALPGLAPAGLHVYDGQIHEMEAAVRERLCDEAFAPAAALRSRIKTAGFPGSNLVAGGTPTFPFHARHEDRECSPGTYVFWDFGYQQYADLDFEIAAVVIARVISKPAVNRLCIDLGYKAIASENAPPRVQFINLPNARAVMHSEEHLVLETPQAGDWKISDILYGVPRHICPTIALHDRVHPVENGIAGEPWRIDARSRTLSI